ncbi:MAG TPA: VWA-like domain-containing protein [Gammaproteobacteria bacterium]
MSELDHIETKLAAARTRLILDKPFLGALVLRLPMVAADANWCKSTATDARTFYYNADYINELSVEQTQFVLAHEALHCALSHFARRGHRQKHRWDLACDFAINPLLMDEGLTPTPEALYLKTFENMTAEEIYPCLDEHENLQPQDDHLYDEENRDQQGGNRGGGGENREQNPDKGKGSQQKQEQQTRDEQGKGNPQEEPRERPAQPPQSGAGKPPPLSQEEQQELAVKWAQRLAGAAQQAMAAGKMSEALARLVDHLLQPQLPWRMLLARYMTASARNDYNYARPSRREGDAIMPSLRSDAIEVVVALDTSGSVSDHEMREFLSEVNAIKGQASARITLLACDANLSGDGPWVYEPWEAFILPRQFPGGGGTDFRPVFAWLEREQRRPDLLVYFTDAQGQFPAQEPALPVIWLVKGRGQVPWGQRIQLN